MANLVSKDLLRAYSYHMDYVLFSLLTAVYPLGLVLREGDLAHGVASIPKKDL